MYSLLNPLFLHEPLNMKTQSIKMIFRHSFVILGVIFGQAMAVQAQSYESLIQEAGKQYEAKQYKLSAELYDKAFKLQSGTALHYYDAACSWALAGDAEKSMNNLKLAGERGWRNLKHLKSDKDLVSLHNMPGWESLLALVQKNLDEYEKDFNKPLKNQLEKIYVRDQTLRQLYQEAENKFGRDSEEMHYFWQLMHEQDSINEQEVIAIIEQHGWAGRSVVGGQANMALWLVIQHAPVETQEKYLPLLRESVKQGESSGNHLALLEDRVLMHRGKPQVYGSQIVTDETTGKYKVYAIAEPEYVNQRRESVGLGPMEEYVKRWGISWTVPQKRK